MAVSNVSIANLALQKLGSPTRLESLTQNHPHARTINACFEAVRNRLLRKYDWNFAIKRDSIAADADDPTWGDWSRYGLPGDFLRLIRDDESGNTVDWKIEGDYILSADAAPLEIRYIARITDPAKFDSLFVDAFAAELAFQVCNEVTGSTGKRTDMRIERDDAVAEAKRVGAIEKSAQEPPIDTWDTARL